MHPPHFLSVDFIRAFDFYDHVAGGDMVVAGRGLTFKTDRPDFFARVGRANGNALVRDRPVQTGFHRLPERNKLTHPKVAQQPGARMTDDCSRHSGVGHKLPDRVLAQFAHQIAQIWIEVVNFFQLARLESRTDLSEP